MPTYDYECRKCRQAFEVELTLAEKEKNAQVSCPICKAAETFQVFRRINMVDSVSTDSVDELPSEPAHPDCHSPGCHSYCGGC